MRKHFILRKRGWLIAGSLLLGAVLLRTWAQDSDLDGMSDDYENFFQLAPTNATDGALNYDDDTLINSNEAVLWTDPWEGDTDYDGFKDDADSNAISRAFIDWGEPLLLTGDEHLYTWPQWLFSASKSGGEWLTNLPTAWHVTSATSNGIGVLWMDIDRAHLSNDVILRLQYFDHTNASLYADLYDTNVTTIVSNLFGNVLAGGNAAVVTKLDVPISAHANAAGIKLRREAGEVTVYSSLLYVDEDADGLDVDQETQLGISDHDSDSDNDTLADSDEVFIHGTNPNLIDSDGDDMDDGTEVLHGQDPTVADGYSTLPFTEDFETNTVHGGILHGQNGWTVDPTNASIVQTSVKYQGDQAAHVGADETASVQNLFGAVGEAEVWVDFYTVVAAADYPDGSISGSAVYFVDIDGCLIVRDGAQWLTLTNHAPLVEGTWIRLTVHADYTLQTWSLYLEEDLLAANLEFASQRGAFGAFRVEAEEAFVDQIQITLGDEEGEIDSDGDGLADWWEIQHFGGIAASPTDDSDKDGFLEIYEYLHGGNPTNATLHPAGTHFVSMSGSQIEPYSNWDTAARSFQAVLLEATNAYDLVLVADGVYSGTTNRGLTLPQHPIMIAATGAMRECTLDAEFYSRLFTIPAGRGRDSVIKGLHMRNGFVADDGGALACLAASPTILECVFDENSSASGGGAVYVSSGGPLLEKCVFTNNNSFGFYEQGGGLLAVSAVNLALKECSFEGNLAWYGGGVGCADSSAEFANCAFVDNYADEGGGGLFADANSTPALANCLFTDNYAAGIADGGAILCANAETVIQNTILWANIPDEIAGPANVEYSLVDDGHPGLGNIDANPNFIPGTLWLSSFSPCIDAGVSNAVAHDAQGEFRWQSDAHVDVVSEWDVGADEYVDSDGDGAPDMFEKWAGTLQADENHFPITLSGTIEYEGNLTGVVRIVATTSAESWSGGFGETLPAPGAFAIRHIPNQSNYWLKAWRDTNGNQSNDAWEAYGVYALNPVGLTSSATGCHIQLVEPDHDNDNIPDWWEHLHDVENASDDPDNDGFSNFEEFDLGLNPTLQADGFALLETTRRRIVNHWNMVMDVPLVFTNAPRSQADLQDMQNAMNAMNGKFYRVVQ